MGRFFEELRWGDWRAAFHRRRNMRSDLPDRKTPAHFPVVESVNHSVIIFVTVCTKDRKPILAHRAGHELLCQAWMAADAWSVGRYMIMPDHLHLFCSPGIVAYPALRKWVQYWKALVSRAWPNPGEQPIWQESCWDTQLRKGESYGEKWEYVRRNPVRQGLCAASDDWPYQGELNVLPWHD